VAIGVCGVPPLPEKVCYVQCCRGNLQPLNADELDVVPASAEGTPLHWTPLLSVGRSKREDLQLMLEIFLGRSPALCAGRGNLEVVPPLHC